MGEVAAGSMPDKELEPGAAIRIMTGAPLPKGTDAVVQFEDTDEVTRKASGGGNSSQIGVLRQVKKGLNVRCKGEDIAKGALILKRGTMLRPLEVEVLASLGRPTALVIRRPIVSVLAT